MHRRVKRSGMLAVALVLGSFGNALAAVHTWRVDEIYSNANGTVQFIEMKTNINGETFFAATGAKLVSKNNANVVQSTFAFPNDLAGSTANKTILIGTANLVSLAGVTPDFILPANFLLPGGGKLEFTSTTFGSLDIDTFPALPGGSSSFNPDTSATALNTPKNFAGVAGQVVPEPSSVALAICGLGLLATTALARRSRKPRTS